MKVSAQHWRVRAFAASFMTALVVFAFAARAQEVNLQSALAEAYLTNPDLLTGQATLRAVDEQVPQALAGYRPRIFLNGDITATDSENDLNASSNESATASLNITQNLYAGGGRAAGVRVAESNVEAERARLIALEQQVLLAAVDSYTSTFRDRRVLALAENNADRLRRQLQATRDRFEVGEVARTDVAQAQARVAGALSDIEAARADLAASQSAYRAVIGSEPDILAKPEELDLLPESLEAAQTIARDNPDIRAAESGLRAAREFIDVATADLLPSLDLNGSLSYTQSPSETVDWQRQAAVGLDLSIPLYQGGGVYSRVREAKQNVRARQNSVESAMRTVQQNVAAAWERLGAARSAVEALMSQVEANRIALEGVEQEALVGQRTVLDVLDAEQELFQSNVDLESAQRAAVLASYQLKSAIGELTAVDVGLDIPTYDARAYYMRNRDRLFGIEIN